MLEMTPKISLIVPAYNEAHVLGSTLRCMVDHLDRHHPAFEILVVVEGTDGTLEVAAELAAREPRIRVIGGGTRGGKGRAVRLGTLASRGRIVGFADADDKTPIDEMERLLPLFEQGSDVVIASRGLATSRTEKAQPWFRRAGSKLFGFYVRCLVGLWDVHDTQCGFKFFRGEVARELFARQRLDGYMFDIELLFLARCLGFEIREVGVRWRDDGDSRLDMLAGNWRNLLDVLRIRALHRSEPQPAAFSSAGNADAR